MWITVFIRLHMWETWKICGQSKALRETIGRLETLLEVEPEIVCCDMHPRYNSVMVAEELGVPVLKVQHHYAHILSCMAENDCAEQVIGVSV